MIQPIRSIRREWHLYWVELDEPLPSEAGGFFLPTLAILVDDGGTPIGRPEILHEIDQGRIEDLLARQLDENPKPDRIVVSSHEEWDAQAWKRFSAEFGVEVRISRADQSSRPELRVLAHKLAADQPRTARPAEIARGLLMESQRARSPSKRVALLRKAVEIDPACSPAKVELGDVEFSHANWEESFRLYDEVAREEAPHWQAVGACWWEDLDTRPFLRALMGRAMVQWQQGDHATAANSLEELLQRNRVDNQGARFLLPLLRLLAGQSERAIRFFQDYEQTYPNDYTEPAFTFAWGLALGQIDEDAAAKAKYRRAIASNLYIAPMLLELPEPVPDIWHPNDRSEPAYASEFIESYASLWDRDSAALRLLREAYEDAQPDVERLVMLRARMQDFQDQRYDPDFRLRWRAFVEEEENLSKLLASGTTQTGD